MKHLLTRVAQPLLALLIFTGSAVSAEPTPELAAARRAAAELLPKLEAGGWQTTEAAFHTINQLARSKEKEDKELSDKLVKLSTAAIVQGLKDMPQPPLQEQLLRDANALADSLLRNPTPGHLKHAREIVGAWEKVQPENVRVRLLRMQLHEVDKKREEQIKLAASLVEEKELDTGNRNYVRDVYVSALLHGKPHLAEDLQRAETTVNGWLKEEPQNRRARLLLLEFHHVKRDWPAQYALATELLKDEKLADSDRRYVQHCRVEGALNTGKTQELNEQDWNSMLEQITGGKGFKKFIDQNWELLLGIAFGLGWLWFLLVAWVTRSMRSRPPGLLMAVLWATIILYASTVILAPLALRITFSLLGLVFLIFATTGSKAPLGYLVAPQANNESGKASWWGVLGRCFVALVAIHFVTLGYSWAFERVMGHPLESQFVAKLMRTETLPKLAGMVLAGGIFVPFLEEVVFRGMLQDWMGRRLSSFWCVTFVSILFGVIHGLEMAIPIAFIGMQLSLLRLRYRSLWPCILLHGLNNSVTIVALYFFPDAV